MGRTALRTRWRRLRWQVRRRAGDSLAYRLLVRLRWQVRRLQGKEVRPAADIALPGESHGSEFAGWRVACGSLPPAPIVYSFGVGRDISFDLSMIAEHGARVFAFDPTPQATAFVGGMPPPPGFRFLPWGLAAHDGEIEFVPEFDDPSEVRHSFNYTARVPREAPSSAGRVLRLPVFALKTIMERLGHPRIDVLKMDIEGMEYEVIESLAAGGIPASQLLVEFHHFLGIGSVDDTLKALGRLREAGFKLFHVSPKGREYSLVRERS